MQQKEARLRGYGNTDFIGNNQTVTSFESLFRQEDNNMPFEFSLVFRRQVVEKRQPLLNDLLPLRREWSGLQLSATPAPQETKHNLSGCALDQRCSSLKKNSKLCLQIPHQHAPERIAIVRQSLQTFQNNFLLNSSLSSLKAQIRCPDQHCEAATALVG